MDNASKALVIAGGILIAVALISLALYMFASARGLVDTSNTILEQSQIESFNRFYFSYAPNGFGKESPITGLDAYNIYRKVTNDNNSETVYNTIDLEYQNVIPDELEDSSNYFNDYSVILYDRNGDTAVDEILIKK